jgi:hypothetical protein
MQTEPEVIECPECGIEARVEGKSLSFSQDDVARHCKHNNAGSICPNIRQALNRVRDSMK